MGGTHRKSEAWNRQSASAKKGPGRPGYGGTGAEGTAGPGGGGKGGRYSARGGCVD